MSVKKEIYLALSNYLMATLNSTPDEHGHLTPAQQEYADMNLPNLVFFDKQMGQMNHPELFNAIPLPAILFSFRRIDWESESRRVQKGNAIFTFWAYFENYADSFNGSMNQEKAIQFFDFNEAVHKALQGLEGEYFTSLDRVSDEDDEDHDMIIGTIFEYATTVADSSADEHRKYTAVTDKGAQGAVVGTITREDRPGSDDGQDNQFIIGAPAPYIPPLYTGRIVGGDDDTQKFENEFENEFE